MFLCSYICLPQGPSRNLLLNGKSYPTKVRLIRGGSLPPVKRRRMNWIDAPDDVFYMATEETRLEPFLGQDGMGVFSCHLLVFTGLPLPTGKSESCSHLQKPSVLPAGPTSLLPCARARPCRCGHPHLHQSMTSPLLLRTRRSPTVACLGPSISPRVSSEACRGQAASLPHQTAAHPTLCFRSAPTPALTRRETAPLVDMRGKKCGLTYSKTPRSPF